MRGIIITLLALGVVATAIPSQALILEPVLSYENGKLDRSGVTDKHNGILVGGRVGSSILGLFYAALDYRTGSVDFDRGGDGERTIMGLHFGADLPLIRAWGGYNFKDELDYGIGIVDGTSITLGVGLGMIPFIELSAEYVRMSEGDDSDESFFVSVSAPFDL